jgi:hypothetical protein
MLNNFLFGMVSFNNDEQVFDFKFIFKRQFRGIYFQLQFFYSLYLYFNFFIFRYYFDLGYHYFLIQIYLKFYRYV